VPQYKSGLEERMAGDPKDVLKIITEGGPGQKKIHKEVQESLEVFEEYKRHREEWAQQFKESQQFRSGVQWTTEQVAQLRKRGQAPIVVNRIHPIVETAKALLTFNKPQFRSTGREDSDRRTSKIFADLAQWLWEVSNGDEHLKIIIDDYYVGGMGYGLVYQDPHADMGKGEVYIKNVYPLDVYVDPNSRDTYFSDSAHILIVKLMTDEQAMKTYKDYENVIRSAEESNMTHYPSTDLKATQGEVFLEDLQDMHHKKREYIERYTRVINKRYHIFEPDTGYDVTYDKKEYEEYRANQAIVIQKADGTETYVTEPEGLYEIGQIIEEFGSIIHMTQPEAVTDPQTGQPIQPPPSMAAGSEEGDNSAIPGSTVVFQLTSKGELVDRDKILVNSIKEARIRVIASVGTKLMYVRELPCEDYPIIPLTNVHNRNPYPLSDVMIYKPLQIYINKIRSLIIAHASTSTNVKLLIPRGSVNKKQVEEEWGRAGTSVIEFDAEVGQPVVAGPVPLPNELYKNESDAKYDLEYGFGVHDIMMGASENAPATFRGTVAIDEYGQRRSKSRQADVEHFLKQMFKVAVPMMQQIHTEEKIIRLVQPDGTVRETGVNIPLYDEFTNQEIGKVHDVSVGKYDIVPVAGSTMPSNRWAQLEVYMQMYQSGLIDQIEVLKKTEVVDTEGVLQRTALVQQLQQELQGAQEEIKKLKGDLQTVEREEVHAKKRLEVEKFKTGLKDAEGTVKKASELYDARLNDQLALQKQMVKPVGGKAEA